MRCEKHLLFYEVIFDKKRNTLLIPKSTKTELVPPNKTKSTNNDMHRKRSDFLKLLLQLTIFAWPLAQKIL